MATDPLARVKRLVRALRDKTTDRGCTEEEAMAAAEKLGALLQEHDLELDETMLKEETGDATKRKVRAADTYAGSVVVGIGRLCDLIVWKNGDTEFVFYGTKHDLEIGSYLYEICCEAMDDDWGKYMDEHGYSMKKRQSFRMGFADRVCRRLTDIKRERDLARQKVSSSTDLVVMKESNLKNQLAKEGIKLRSGGRQRSPADRQAYARGAEAGDRVNLNSPLGGPAASAGRLS